ncbi:hypothetical protein DPEC_G00266850 [Dallia pectoralis]|uniref:Uncharacterized protein n=1 Tax=Dallia pectoralis TaxID=75939 RepID=A0ACC2FNL9_DALPE|nr:hypothetical protein DPEC_G00266850 [Dallia pectoralis]
MLQDSLDRPRPLLSLPLIAGLLRSQVPGLRVLPVHEIRRARRFMWRVCCGALRGRDNSSYVNVESIPCWDEAPVGSCRWLGEPWSGPLLEIRHNSFAQLAPAIRKVPAWTSTSRVTVTPSVPPGAVVTSTSTSKGRKRAWNADTPRHELLLPHAAQTCKNMRTDRMHSQSKQPAFSARPTHSRLAFAPEHNFPNKAKDPERKRKEERQREGGDRDRETGVLYQFKRRNAGVVAASRQLTFPPLTALRGLRPADKSMEFCPGAKGPIWSEAGSPRVSYSPAARRFSDQESTRLTCLPLCLSLPYCTLGRHWL